MLKFKGAKNFQRWKIESSHIFESWKLKTQNLGMLEIVSIKKLKALKNGVVNIKHLKIESIQTLEL